MSTSARAASEASSAADDFDYDVPEAEAPTREWLHKNTQGKAWDNFAKVAADMYMRKMGGDDFFKTNKVLADNVLTDPRIKEFIDGVARVLFSLRGSTIREKVVPIRGALYVITHIFRHRMNADPKVEMSRRLGARGANTCDFLKETEKSTKPFFIAKGFMDHGNNIYDYIKRLWDAYALKTDPREDYNNKRKNERKAHADTKAELLTMKREKEAQLLAASDEIHREADAKVAEEAAKRHRAESELALANRSLEAMQSSMAQFLSPGATAHPPPPPSTGRPAVPPPHHTPWDPSRL